ncbi:hypothetical protein EYF80_043077 [Liparis tanakae]|uniref:Uncharacterized protein n=1 Tax=Liparis tanakae TaxID=230148 RepID=A0A4Z2FZG9_9TELE|nr:hypothetical protein EYF80_043077 [Liparis tanakae]
MGVSAHRRPRGHGVVILQLGCGAVHRHALKGPIYVFFEDSHASLFVLQQDEPALGKPSRPHTDEREIGLLPTGPPGLPSGLHGRAPRYRSGPFSRGPSYHKITIVINGRFFFMFLHFILFLQQVMWGLLQRKKQHVLAHWEIRPDSNPIYSSEKQWRKCDPSGDYYPVAPLPLEDGN